jgi:cofilin
VYHLGDDNKKIMVEKVMSKEATYEDFLKLLPEDDCRYAVYDFEYRKGEDEGVRSKICFIVWAPDAAKVRQKMLYASSKDSLRKSLAGIMTEIQATDASEIAHETVLDKVRAI